MNFKRTSSIFFCLADLLSAKTIILSSFIAVYLALFIRFFSSAIFKGSLNKWAFTDWLTNYSAGFVRRGLSGSFLLFMAQNFNLDAYLTVTIFVYASYLAVSIFYLYKIAKLRQNINIVSLITLLFLPSLLFFPLNDLGALGRKEILFLFPLLLNLTFFNLEFNKLKINNKDYSLLKDQDKANLALKQYCTKVFIWFNLLCIPITLIHESIVFLSLPLNIIITISFVSLRLSLRQSIVSSLAVYMPTIIAIMAGFVWKGDAAVALHICESWQNLNILECGKKVPGALDAIGWSLRDGISLSWSIVKAERGKVFTQWLLIFISNLVFLLFASSNIISNLLDKSKPDGDRRLTSSTKKKLYASFSFKYVIIPMIVSAPLYMIGWDWGRWFFLVAISYSFCSLTPNLIYLELANQNLLKKFDLLNWLLEQFCLVYSKILSSVFYIIKKHYWLYIIALTYMLSLVTLPHCCLASSVFHQGLLNRIISLF